MTLSLVVSILGIALLDSLNPSLFVAQFYLLMTQRPVPRLLSYIAGILTVNFLGGVLILNGARVLLAELFSGISTVTLYHLQLIIGLAILGFGFWMRVSSQEPVEAKKPRSLHPMHTFLLGMVVMLNEMTTALPYFVAIERMVQAQLNTLETFIMLMGYNIVFSLPLFGFLLMLMLFKERFATQIERINHAIQYWSPRIIKYGSLMFGGVLMLNAGTYLLVGTALFNG